MALFVWNRLRYDLAALLGLSAAVASGVVPPDRAFVGFGDPVVIIIASALVISAGVGKSGVIGRVIRHLEPRLRTTGMRVAVLTGCVTVLSAFMKNIGALAIFLPIAVQVARRACPPPLRWSGRRSPIWKPPARAASPSSRSSASRSSVTVPPGNSA